MLLIRQNPREVVQRKGAAPDDLFKVGKDCKKLRPDKAVEFHNLVAKTLYATK
jgi:hypothetical protein